MEGPSLLALSADIVQASERGKNLAQIRILVAERLAQISVANQTMHFSFCLVVVITTFIHMCTTTTTSPASQPPLFSKRIGRSQYTHGGWLLFSFSLILKFYRPFAFSLPTHLSYSILTAV